MQAVLRQDISWYDTTTTTDFASRMTDDLTKLEDGIGEKIGMLAYFLGIFLVSHIGKAATVKTVKKEREEKQIVKIIQN